MDCPYFRYHGNCWIKCQRGYSVRYRLFARQDKFDKHTGRYCNNKYTACRNYEKLENDW